MSNVNITLSVDEDLKEQADMLFSELGLNLSTAFRIFLFRSVREQGIPFRIAMHTPNAVTLAAMDDAENGENLFGPFDSTAALMESLNA